MNDHQLVLIVWSDAAHIQPGDWMAELPASTAATISTVGWLCADNQSHVVIAHSLDDAGQMTGVFSIPTSNIISRRNINA